MNSGGNDEAKLAQEALAKIRAWSLKRRKIKGEDPLPRLALKFCGGCNPVIERGYLARIIRENLAGMVLWVPAEEEADLLLIISGCLTACADRLEVREKAANVLAIAGLTISFFAGEDSDQKSASGN